MEQKEMDMVNIVRTNLCRIQIKILTVLVFCLVFLAQVFSQDLQSGPMTGYSAMREASVWIQTTRPAHVIMEYREMDTADAWTESEPIQTEKNSFFTGILVADEVEPGKKYEYRIKVDKNVQESKYPQFFRTQSLWQWRNDPPEFKFVTGSCFYVNEEKYDRPGRPFGGAYNILNHIAQENADFMIWLGDNTYLREADWDSKTGIYKRYTHTRSLPELQPVLSSMHHYAIWDDHDYGPNDSDRIYPFKEVAKQAFKDFWANPNYVLGPDGGITGSFVWSDCQFFLLDNRWYRSPQSENGQIIGQQQMDWLIESLRYSQSPFKFVSVGGQFVSNYPAFENHAVFAEERQKLIDLIDLYKIQGVVFLTGDRHHSEISKLTTASGIEIFDITSSPLAAGSYDHKSETNTLRIQGSIHGVKNYACIEVSGPKNKRSLVVTYKNSDGEELSMHTLYP
jgi:alkaline phosphatase D